MSYRALAVLLLLAAPAACKKANSAGGGPGGAGGFAMPVEVSPAIRDTVVDAIAATGQIEAVQSVDLRPEVDGRIVEILVREGQDVAAGAGLFKGGDWGLQAQAARGGAARAVWQRQSASAQKRKAPSAPSQAALWRP